MPKDAGSEDLRPIALDAVQLRQQLLFLWLEGTSLDERVLGWAFYDGSAGNGPAAPVGTPPYDNGVHALVDGWRLLSAPEPRVRIEGTEHYGGLDYQFMFERLVEGVRGGGRSSS